MTTDGRISRQVHYSNYYIINVLNTPKDLKENINIMKEK